MLFSFNRTRSPGDGDGLYTIYAELQKITGKLGKAKLNNLPFLAGILKSAMIQRNQLCPDLSDFKEIKNQIKTHLNASIAEGSNEALECKFGQMEEF